MPGISQVCESEVFSLFSAWPKKHLGGGCGFNPSKKYESNGKSSPNRGEHSKNI